MKRFPEQKWCTIDPSGTQLSDLFLPAAEFSTPPLNANGAKVTNVIYLFVIIFPISAFVYFLVMVFHGAYLEICSDGGNGSKSLLYLV